MLNLSKGSTRSSSGTLAVLRLSKVAKSMLWREESAWGAAARTCEREGEVGMG